MNDGEEIAIKQTLQCFLAIIFDADPSTPIPPFLKLGRNDHSYADILADFPVEKIKDFAVLKRCLVYQ
jgi:hypothetical protein